MLENIRLQAMRRVAEKKNSANKWANDWSPSSMELFHENKEDSVGTFMVFNGDDGFEIGEGNDKHTVLMERKLCTCRAWELTSILCAHAIRAMYYLKMNLQCSLSVSSTTCTKKAIYEM